VKSVSIPIVVGSEVHDQEFQFPTRRKRKNAILNTLTNDSKINLKMDCATIINNTNKIIIMENLKKKELIFTIIFTSNDTNPKIVWIRDHLPNKFHS